jgi:hypothetical protein
MEITATIPARQRDVNHACFFTLSQHGRFSAPGLGLSLVSCCF